MAPETGAPGAAAAPEPPKKAGETLSTKTRRGLLWTGGEAVTRTAVQFGVLAIMARLLTPEDYGSAGAAMVVVGISAMFAQLGVGPSLVQRPEILPRHRHAAFHVSTLLGVLTGVLVALGAPMLAGLFRIPEMADLLRGLSIVFPISGLAVVSESGLQRDMRFDLLARAEIISYCAAFGAVGIPLAWAGWGAWALVWAQIGQSCAKSFLFLFYRPFRPALAWEWSALRDLLHFGGGLTLARLANYVATNGDNFVVGRWLGAEALGVYSRAYQLMVTPASVVGNVLDKVLFPAMAKVQGNDAQLARVYAQGTALLALVMLPASAMIYILAPEIVALLLGPKWTSVVYPLQFFSIVLLFRTSMKLSTSLVRAKGKVYLLAITQVWYGVAVLGLAAAGLPWGVEGVCAGVLLAITICFVIMSAASMRLIGMSSLKFLAAHFPALRLTAVMALIGVPATAYLRGLHWEPFVLLLAAGPLMLASAVLLIAALPRIFLGAEGEPMRDQALQSLKRLLGSKILPSHL